jgi:hypothetical protein
MCEGRYQPPRVTATVDSSEMFMTWDTMAWREIHKVESRIIFTLSDVVRLVWSTVKPHLC